ncbi:hypothetical protein [Mycobacterium sp.]|uniref:hypothetical protein n=1 Tax=Mycobacterium sp. TaxID=1785 RepID=UPI0031D64555
MKASTKSRLLWLRDLLLMEIAAGLFLSWIDRLIREKRVLFALNLLVTVGLVICVIWVVSHLVLVAVKLVMIAIRRRAGTDEQTTV